MYLVISSMFYPTKYLLDLKASQALRKIMDAMNIWADCIRVHPDDLVNDEPYNIIIFQPPVKYFIKENQSLKYERISPEGLIESVTVK